VYAFDDGAVQIIAVARMKRRPLYWQRRLLRS
jgi:hypothetical protein